MAFDGSEWDEANPTNASLANEIDDNMRDMKQGVRSRANREHIWPSSQSATSEGGPHRYITFEPQTGAPTLPIVGTTTQIAALYFNTDGAGIIRDSAGTSYTVFESGKGQVLFSGTSTLGTIPVVTSGGGVHALTASKLGYTLVSQTNTATPTWLPVAARAFGRFEGTTGTLAVDYELSSVTRNGSGDYTVNFSTVLPNTNYLAPVSAQIPSAGSDPIHVGAKNYTVSSVDIIVVRGGTAAVDVSNICVTIFTT